MLSTDLENRGRQGRQPRPERHHWSWEPSAFLVRGFYKHPLRDFSSITSEQGGKFEKSKCMTSHQLPSLTETKGCGQQIRRNCVKSLPDRVCYD